MKQNISFTEYMPKTATMNIDFLKKWSKTAAGQENRTSNKTEVPEEMRWKAVGIQMKGFQALYLTSGAANRRDKGTSNELMWLA
jgi:hypothetical protein